MKVQVLTFNLGDSQTVSGRDWDAYLSRTDLVKTGDHELKIVTVQESPGTSQFIQSLQKLLRRDYQTYTKSYGSLLAPKYYVHVLVAARRGVKNLAQRPVFKGWKHNAFGSKSTIAVMLRVGHLNIQVNSSHLPFGSSKPRTGYKERVAAMRDVISQTLKTWVPDVMLWMGDLNFRIESSGKDQIYEALASLNGGFKSVPIETALHPTCKVRHSASCSFRRDGTMPGQDCYNASRQPSYCDRVLVSVKNPTLRVQETRIDTLPSGPPVSLSDHVPVLVELSITTA